MIAFASSLDQAGPFTRDVTDAALLLSAHGRPGPVRQHQHRPARAGHSCRRRPTSRASASACPEELTGEGIEPGVLDGVQRDARPRPRARRDGRDDAPAALAARPRRLLPDRAGRVLVEPRPLRRRALRLPRRRRRAACSGCTPRRASRASAPRSSGACMLGTYALSSGYYDAYYGRAQKVRTLIARDFDAPPGRASTSSSRPTAPGRRVRARRQDRRPARDVPQRRLHGADVARRHPGASRSRTGSPRACRSASRSPARRSARTASSTRRTRSSRRSASTDRGRSHDATTNPSSGWRSTSSSRPARRCSAAAS